ncbi:hypothetical protein MJ389_04315 [Escherichia coli]|nr:hypothetical protein MJ389_04315 [Escherichia coli]
MRWGSFYLDIIKDRQYTAAKADSVARRSCQTALYHIAEALVALDGTEHSLHR